MKKGIGYLEKMEEMKRGGKWENNTKWVKFEVEFYLSFEHIKMTKLSNVIFYLNSSNIATV